MTIDARLITPNASLTTSRYRGFRSTPRASHTHVPGEHAPDAKQRSCVLANRQHGSATVKRLRTPAAERSNYAAVFSSRSRALSAAMLRLITSLTCLSTVNCAVTILPGA